MTSMPEIPIESVLQTSSYRICGSAKMMQNMSRWMVLTGRIGMRILQPEFIFAAMALAAGLVLVFVNGPFQTPDERAHFFRAYQISEGHFFAERIDKAVGGWLPATVRDCVSPFINISTHREIKVRRESLTSSFHTPLNEQEKVFVSFSNTARNVPLCYFPQAAGICVSRQAGLSPLQMMYAGRMMNLFCWIVFMCAAIRLTPVFKWVIVLVGIMPMNLYLAASLSADTMINACAVLFAGLLLNERFREKGFMTMGKRVGIGFLSIALSVMKLVYAPLAALVFMIPERSFGSNRKRIAYTVSVIGLSLLAIFLWGLEIRRIYIPLNESSMPLQLTGILAAPWRFLGVLVNSVQIQGSGYFYSFIGVLGWLDTWLPQWIYVTFFPVLAAAALFEPSGRSLSLRLRGKAALLAVCLLSFFLIVLSQYLTWTKPGTALVEGVQGRYFIPLLIPVMLLLINRIRLFKIEWLFGGIITLYSALVLRATCLTVFERYYG